MPIDIWPDVVLRECYANPIRVRNRLEDRKSPAQMIINKSRVSIIR